MTPSAIPHNLDEYITAEEQREASRQAYGAFHWYRGLDAKGQPDVFRMMRGAGLLMFHKALLERDIVAVAGPFKTRKAAQAASDPSLERPDAPPPAARDISLVMFQMRVQQWAQACFGTAAADPAERGHRFVEEALEMAQAAGVTAEEVKQLVDYVFSRPVGTVACEAGGTLITLAALCTALNSDLADNACAELRRVEDLKDRIRAKHLARPKNSPLPGAVS